MIDIEEARRRIGDGVVYRPHPQSRPEEGEITSVNDTFVFVRSVGDRGSKATHPGDLDWA